MSDIVERLRDTNHHPWEICSDAATEIERLRTELAAAQLTIAEACHELDCSAVDWDSPVLRASQLLQAAIDQAMQEKT